MTAERHDSIFGKLDDLFRRLFQSKPAEAVTPALQPWWIPVFTEIIEWIRVPKAQRLLASDALEKLCSVAEQPIDPLGSFAPRLSASTIVFTIPLERCSTVQVGDGVEQRVEFEHIAQHVVMVGQHDPSKHGTAVLMHQLTELCREAGETLIGASNDGRMFKAGGGDQIDRCLIAFDMCRRMLRMLSLLSFGEDNLSLFRSPCPPPSERITTECHRYSRSPNAASPARRLRSWRSLSSQSSSPSRTTIGGQATPFNMDALLGYGKLSVVSASSAK